MKKREKRKKREKIYKKCPRCGNSCLQSQTRCEECGLLFSRLEIATNAAAKKQLRRFNRDFIIYTNKLPKDVKRWKIIVYALLFGLVGGQYYYVGKYGKALMMTGMFVYLIITTVLNEYIADTVLTLLYIPVGIYAVAWMVGIMFACTKKFKVPILAELPNSEDAEKLREDFEKTSQDLMKEKESLEKENVQKDNIEKDKIQKDKIQNGNIEEENLQKRDASKVENESQEVLKSDLGQQNATNDDNKKQTASVARKTGKISSNNSGSKNGSKSSAKKGGNKKKKSGKNGKK